VSDAPLAPGYAKRAPIIDDAPAVARVIAACQRADGDDATMTAEEVVSDWEGADLAEEAVAVTAPDGQIAAYADLVNRRYVQTSVYGYVHPDHRGRGLGAALVRWGETWTRDRLHRAPAPARVVVQHFVRAADEAAVRLMETCGYTPVRTHYVMAIELDGPRPSPAWPTEIAVRPFVAGQDDWALYEAGEDAYRDMWGRPPSTLDRWLAPTRAEGFDPTLWFLAEDQRGGEVAAFCLCMAVAGRGHVNSLGVRRAYRRRGLGLALLLHAFGEFYRRGVREVDLSVDAESRTGAPRLYGRAGMLITKSYVLYRKELRPGEDISAPAGDE